MSLRRACSEWGQRIGSSPEYGKYCHGVWCTGYRIVFTNSKGWDWPELPVGTLFPVCGFRNQPTNKRVRLWLVRRAQEEARHCPCRQNSADRGSLRCASRPRVKRDTVRGRRDYFMQKSRLCQKTRGEKRSRKGRRYRNAKPQCRATGTATQSRNAQGHRTAGTKEPHARENQNEN